MTLSTKPRGEETVAEECSLPQEFRDARIATCRSISDHPREMLMLCG